ncbi:hypothetical protein CXG81DRAFT_25027 [Caulochytrium protostelioides]|uniref:UDP-N-acetylglucosamine transferase subunit ALG14 n=1 Tax=Caulochytrium protostelioides TaxID=1555241 RepID=A0A4P9XAH8_9FUNG|nr:hypothetical protein CXG81DRAFT_25027 [Caulochytrium protostelioides]|eukprot:RKP02335.1 hypothetical protein CXG81DRAFT_25027 [Caulochytrium protostelioides]
MATAAEQAEAYQADAVTALQPPHGAVIREWKAPTRRVDWTAAAGDARYPGAELVSPVAHARWRAMPVWLDIDAVGAAVAALIGLLAALWLSAAALLAVLAAPAPAAAAAADARVLVVLGSGGHSAEMLQLLRHLTASEASAPTASARAAAPSRHVDDPSSSLPPPPPPPYGRFQLVVSDGDAWSLSAAARALSPSQRTPTASTLPRARRVAQSWRSTPWTTAVSLAAALHLAARERPRTRLVLLNGPGTAAVVAVAVWTVALLALPLRLLPAPSAPRPRWRPRLVFVETFARVRRLSLTARLCRPLVDVLVVPWPELLATPAGQHRNVVYLGQLM